MNVSSHVCPSLSPLIEQLRAIWESVADPEQRMRRAKPLMEHFIAQPEFRDRARTWPMTPMQNLMFYEDPDYGFALCGTVRKAGSPEGVHDHAHTWTLYGIVDGDETMERYEQIDDGSREGYAELRRTSATRGSAGDVDLVAPFAIHCERATPERSSALILRSERLGKPVQRLFNLEKRSFALVGGPKQVPYSF
jgi:predicted metal-dependent enzyme (double-stranded beta helix superfamily)